MLLTIGYTLPYSHRRERMLLTIGYTLHYSHRGERMHLTIGYTLHYSPRGNCGNSEFIGTKNFALDNFCVKMRNIT